MHNLLSDDEHDPSQAPTRFTQQYKISHNYNFNAANYIAVHPDSEPDEVDQVAARKYDKELYYDDHVQVSSMKTSIISKGNDR